MCNDVILSVFGDKGCFSVILVFKPNLFADCFIKLSNSTPSG